MRKIPIVTGEVYHIFNRGTDKRVIFTDDYDILRFMKSMEVFNTVNPIGSIFEQQFKKEVTVVDPIITIIGYCVLSNHFHLIVRQEKDKGISQYIQKLAGGYTWYFNNKYKRSGSLFQGKYKSAHVDSNEYLLYLSAYVNLNNQQHFGDPTAKSLKFLSSFNEYMGDENSKEICLGKELVLGQFKDRIAYKDFAYTALEEIRSNKKRYALLDESEK